MFHNHELFLNEIELSLLASLSQTVVVVVRMERQRSNNHQASPWIANSNCCSALVCLFIHVQVEKNEKFADNIKTHKV